MQYLMVLLLSVGVLVLMIAVILALSYALGALMHSRGGVQANPSNTDPCAQFRADRDWYEGLPFWKQSLVTAWWLANRYQCSARGCR